MTVDAEFLPSAVTKVVRELPDGPFHRLVDALEGAAGSARDVHDVVSTPRARDRIDTLMKLARDAGLTDPAVAMMLRCARLMRSEPSMERIELVWTGPTSPRMALYKTEQTLLEMITTAEKHVLIVTFAAYKVDAIRDALRDALLRGVRVDLVLEQAEHEGGKVSLDPAAALATGTHDGLRVLVWPADRRPTSAAGKYGSLHAKCAVVDDRVLLVSSANLTEYALELNMELGVRIEGGSHPCRVREHFDDLVRRRVLAILEVPPGAARGYAQGREREST